MKQLILALLLFNGLQVYAGERGGNGGDGIWVGNKLYSLDLVEAGVEEDPYFDSSIVPNQRTVQRLKRTFNSSQYPVNLIAQKMEEIKNLSPVFSQLLIMVSEQYQWRLVNSELIDIKDEDSLLNSNRLVQLAIRKERTILIDKKLFKELDDKNKVGLILHEILYALILPTSVLVTEIENGKKVDRYYYEQRSDIVRQVNGYLFSSDLNSGTENFNKFVRGGLDLSDFHFNWSSMGFEFQNRLIMTHRVESGEKWSDDELFQSVCRASKEIQTDTTLGYMFLDQDQYQTKDKVFKKYIRISSQYDKVRNPSKNFPHLSDYECKDHLESFLSNILK
ncbi:MAG: hypothetical protein AB7I27_15095 [Bacteriovoracaceae bacterium]